MVFHRFPECGIKGASLSLSTSSLHNLLNELLEFVKEGSPSLFIKGILVGALVPIKSNEKKSREMSESRTRTIA